MKSFHRNRWLLALALAPALSACADPPPPPPPPPPNPRRFKTSGAMWSSDVNRGEDDDGRVFIVTQTVEIQDTLPNAKRDVRILCRRRAVETETREALRTFNRTKLMHDQAPLLERLIFKQPQKYIRKDLILERQYFEDQNRYGMKLKVWVDRNRIERVLQDEGLIRGKRDEMQVIVYARPGSKAEKELAEDLQDKMAEIFNNRGWDATTWDSVLADLTEDRNLGDKSTQAMFKRLVDDPDFVPTDRFKGALTLLRQHGRLLITYHVAVARVRGQTANVYVEGRMRDLLTRRIVATDRKKKSKTFLSHKDPRAELKDLLYKASEELARSFVEKAHDFYDKQIKKRIGGRALTLSFVGYTNAELTRIERIVQETFDQAGSLTKEGNKAVADVTYTQKNPAYYKRRLLRSLRRAKLDALPPPIGEEDTLEFRKKGSDDD